MMALENRITKLELKAGMTKRKYPFDFLIEYDETMTQEDIQKIMDERKQQSGTIFFVLLPKKNSY